MPTLTKDEIMKSIPEGWKLEDNYLTREIEKINKLINKWKEKIENT